MGNTLTRRTFLETLGKSFVIAAGTIGLGIGSDRIYDTMKKNHTIDPNQLQATTEELEKHGITIYDWLLFANFSSAVYNMAQGEKSYIYPSKKVGQGVKRLFDKLPYSQEISDHFGKFSNAKLVFLQETFQGVQDLIGKDIPHLDHEFPHAELATGIFLNMLYAGQGEHEKEKVIHGIQETGIGVGLLVFSTMIGKAIRPNKPTHVEIQKDYDEITSIEEIETTGDFIADCKTTVDGICNSMGATLIGVPFKQLATTAYGSATSIGKTMKHVLLLTQILGKQLQGKSISEIEEYIPQIENPVIQKILVAIIKENASQTKEKGETNNIFTDDMIDQFVTTYSNRVNIGLMSPAMDIGQSAGGDVAPAIIGAYQSFGIEHALKTCVANFPLSFLSMFTETFFLTSQRLGVPLKKLINKESIQSMIMDVIQTHLNLIKGILLQDQAKSGSSYQGNSIVNDVSNTLGGIFYYRQQGGAEKLAAKVMATLMQEDSDFESELITLQNSDGVSLKDAGITAADVGKLSSLQQIFAIPAEEIAVAIKQGTSPTDIIDSYGEKSILAAKNLDDIYDILKQKMRDQGNDEGSIDRLKVALAAMPEDINTFIDAVKDINPSTGFMENMHKIQALQTRTNNPMKMLTFDYWKEVVGSEIAETVFVVFLQGIHAVGLLPIFSSFMGENDMMIFAKYTGFSMVADNRLAQITAAKEMSQKQLEQSRKDMENDHIGFIYNPMENVTDNFNNLVKQLCETRNQDCQSITRQELNDIYMKFCEIKALSVIAGVGGGGESTIGNAPHFSAIVDELKTYMTLPASLKDMVDFPVQHAWRLAFGYARGKFGAPAVEMAIFENPFIAIATSTGVTIE